jgi:hypothetical protein
MKKPKSEFLTKKPSGSLPKRTAGESYEEKLMKKMDNAIQRLKNTLSD